MKKIGLTLALILVAASGAYSSIPRPATSGTALACPELPPDCCRTQIVSGCRICTQTGCA
jgi:hypothetical protein